MCEGRAKACAGVTTRSAPRSTAWTSRDARSPGTRRQAVAPVGTGYQVRGFLRGFFVPSPTPLCVSMRSKPTRPGTFIQMRLMQRDAAFRAGIPNTPSLCAAPAPCASTGRGPPRADARSETPRPKERDARSCQPAFASVTGGVAPRRRASAAPARRATKRSWLSASWASASARPSRRSRRRRRGAFACKAAKTRQRLRSPARVTLREAAEAFMEGIRSGAIANRSGETYKPSAVRSYEQALASHVLPDPGGMRLGDVTAADLQALVERLRGEGPEREHDYQRAPPGAGALSPSDAAGARDAQPLPRRQPADDPQPARARGRSRRRRADDPRAARNRISAHGLSRSTAGCGLES